MTDKRRILFIEDEPSIIATASKRLKLSGCEVVVAEDGGVAIAMAQSEMPDLIIMDMSLPVIDGWEATRKIKSTKQTRDIPVIALTAEKDRGASDASRTHAAEVAQAADGPPKA